MALSVKKGTFAAALATGNQSIAGVGFQPKAVIFFLAPATADGNSGNFSGCVGMAVSPTQQTDYAWVSDDAVGTSQCANEAETDEVTSCLRVLTQAGSVVVNCSATLVSMDVDGFTISWFGTAPSSAWVIHYIAIGGSDVTNAKIGRISPSNVNGTNSAYTGIGFQPDFVMFLAPVFNGGAAARGDLNVNIGAAGTDGTTLTQGAEGYWEDDAATTMAAGSVQHSTAAIRTGTGTTGADNVTGSVSSLDADGFHILWSDAASSLTNVVLYLALKGGKYQVGMGAQKASTGTQAYTTTFQPVGLLAVMNHQTADGFVFSGAMGLGIGASDGAAAGYVCGSQNDANTTSSAKRRHITNKVIGAMTSPTPTLNAEAGIPAGGLFQTTSFTLDWTTADTTVRRFLWVAFGSSGAATSTAGPRPTVVSQAVMRAGSR